MLVGTELLQFGHERIDDCDIISFPFAGMENTLYREQLEERPISMPLVRPGGSVRPEAHFEPHRARSARLHLL